MGKVMGKDGEIVCGKEEVREVWKKVFENLLSRPSSNSDEELELEGLEIGVSEVDDDFLNRPVEAEEVWEALRR